MKALFIICKVLFIICTVLFALLSFVDIKCIIFAVICLVLAILIKPTKMAQNYKDKQSKSGINPQHQHDESSPEVIIAPTPATTSTAGPLTKHGDVKMKKALWKKWWFWLIIVIVVVIIVGVTENSNEPQQPDGTAQLPASSSQNVSSNTDDSSPAENEEEKSVWYKAGMYKVGSDIPAGEYLVQASGSCYMQVSTDSTGSLTSIATNDNFSDWRYITLLDGQYLTVDRGSFASIDDIAPITSSTGTYAAGMYKVGRDIAAGEYKIEAIGNCYLEVANDSTGSLYSIANNDNIKTGESRYVTVSDGQYIQFNNAVMTPVN